MNDKTNWKLLATCLAASCLATVHVSAHDIDASGGDDEAVRDTIAQINHINWVVNTIKTYNNVVVLEEEYEKISSGNLNLNRIPDEETLNRIAKMLDTLYALRKDDRNIRYWRRNFYESRDRKLETYKLKASRQAVDTLTAQAKACCSLWDWEMNPGGSLIAVAQTAWNMSHYSVSLYNDYDNFVYEIDKTAAEQEFAFDTAKMDVLHQQNKDLLQDQWRLIRRYRLDDHLRVSDVDIKMLLAALKDDSHSRIYNRLVPMNERFCLFPEYWYYLSCAALETGHFEKGIEACDTFFKVNRGIFRDDPMVGTVALNKAFMLTKTDANKPELRRCLEIAWENNSLRGDWQISYLAAIMYKGCFNDKDKAEMMLEHAVSLIESAIRERQQYSSKAGVTLEEGLLNCRNALHQLRGEPLEQARRQEKKKIFEYKAAKTGDTMTITLPGGARMEMIYVSPGSFMMGSENGHDDEKPVHRVTITKGFWLGKYEVTQAQWKSVMGSNTIGDFLPRAPAFVGANRPIDSVGWHDCQDFIKKVNAKLENGVVRLPTEAEWEYACRAGTTGDYSGTGKLDDMGWNGNLLKNIWNLLSETRGDGTHSVGCKKSNAWGFYDMHGNVREWCNDWYGGYHYGDVTDPVGPSSGEAHVSRGGSWESVSGGCTSSCRYDTRYVYDGDSGFRLCYSAEPCE